MASLTKDANDMHRFATQPAPPDPRDIHAWAHDKVRQTLLTALLGIASEYMTYAEWHARAAL